MRRAIDINKMSYTNNSTEEFFEGAFRLARESRARGGWANTGKKSIRCRLGLHDWSKIDIPESPNDDYVKYCRRDGCDTLLYVEDSLMYGY